MRYVVTEIEGYATADSLRKGLSTMVLDTAHNHRVVKTWRSEDYRTAMSRTPYAQARLRAAKTCVALNGGEPAPTYFGRVLSLSHECPGCGGRRSGAAGLCRDCYRESVESAHGTANRYTRHGCRCELCVAARRDYMRTYMREYKKGKRRRC